MNRRQAELATLSKKKKKKKKKKWKLCYPNLTEYILNIHIIVKRKSLESETLQNN